jgi:aminocarboxymuconate-semialdehyde decarboxylase
MEFGPAFTDVSTQLAAADATGHDIVMVSSLGADLLNFPGLSVAEASELATIANEARAEAQRDHPTRIVGIAAIPWGDPDAAVAVFDQAITEMGLRGVSLPSNVDGVPIDDERFLRVYARIEEAGVPVLLHPVWSVLADRVQYEGDHVEVMLGWPVDSSIGALRLALSGVLERHSGLKIIHHHAGGVLPYLAGRIDTTARLEPSYDLPHLPSVYLKRMYADTAVMSADTIRLATAFYGEGHMVFGSDHPFWPVAESIPVVETAHSGSIPSAVLEANAAALLGIP